MNEDFIKPIKVDFMYGVEEPWCNNQGVAILPYVLKDNKYHFLLTKEYNPLFKNKQISEYSTITGGLENFDPYQTVINEMLEETGIDIRNDRSKTYYLGKHYANKSSTKLWYFFVLDLTDMNLDLTKTYKGTGDGTEAEKEISSKFVNYKELNKSNDILGLANWKKFSFKIKRKKELKEIIENEAKEQIAYDIFEFIVNVFNDKKLSQSYEAYNYMIKNLNNYVDKKLISIDKSWIIVNSSSKLVKNLKKEAEEYANMDVIIKNKSYCTLLHSAIKDNNCEIIKLSTANSEDIHLQDKENNTPLHWAVDNGDFKIIELLLAQGSNINAQDENGYTPLEVAVANPFNNTQIVKLLLENGADPNIKSNDGFTPLHWAVENQNFEMVKLLIDNNVDVNDDISFYSERDNDYLEKISKVLIKNLKNGADVNIKTIYRDTPLHWAVDNGDFKITELLLAQGSNINAQDEEGFTPLYYAVDNGDFKITELLLAQGSNINAQDEEGFTPLYYAVDNGDFKITELLIKNGADVNIKFNNGNIALDYAEEDKNLQIINLLHKKYTLTTLNNKRKSFNNELTNFKKTKLSEFLFDKQEINSMELTNQPSTSGYNNRAFFA